MTKYLFQKKYFFNLRVISNLSLALLFALQPSAEAFLGTLQFNPISSAQSGTAIQASGEINTIADKSLLQTALLPIQNRSSEIQAVPVTDHTPVSMSTYQNRYRQFARVMFASQEQNSIRRYQSYELNADGTLGRVIETGHFAEGEFIRERVYDYNAGTVVLHNLNNIFEKRIYELNKNGEPGRPVQYRGRNSTGDLMNVRFVYRTATVTSIHMKSMTYSVYRFQNGVLGDLIEVGTIRSLSKQNGFHARSRITISEMTRQAHRIPVYIFHGADGSKITRERIGGSSHSLGTMGRVLRFVNSETDLEYFYEEAALGQSAKVKVLNHRLGESLTFEVMGSDLQENSGRLSSSDHVLRVSLVKAVPSSLKLFLHNFSTVVGAALEVTSFPIYIRLNEQVLIWEKLLRGPPAFSRTLFSFLLFPSLVPSFETQISSFLTSVSFFRVVL